MLGVDYSFGKPGGKIIKEQGYEFVARYLSTPLNSKNLTKDELQDLQANGLKVVLVWETTTGRPLQGYGAGCDDALMAKHLVNALGIEVGLLRELPVIYFACDDDFTTEQLKDIQSYFQGINTVLSKSKVGVYGGVNTVGAMFDADLVTYGWQTAAWSNGDIDDRAQLYQSKDGEPVLNGVQCDTNESQKDDFGQF